MIDKGLGNNPKKEGLADFVNEFYSKIKNGEPISRNEFLKAGAIGLGVGVTGGGILNSLGCFLFKKRKKEEKEPEPGIYTLVGYVPDVLSSERLEGVEVKASSGESATTNANGDFTLTYTKYPNANDPQITFAKGNYTTRKSYPGWGPDFSIIPNSFNMDEFNRICRPSAYSNATIRWPSDKKPDVYIVTDDGPPQYLENIIIDIVNNDIPKITKNVLNNLTIQKGSRANAPDRDVIVYDYRRDEIGAGVAIHQNNNVIYWARVRLGGSNADGSEHIFKRYTIIHETGHAIGFDGHATTRDSIMYPAGVGSDYPIQMDIDNGTVVYSRPAKNTSPDNDPYPSDSVNAIAYGTFINFMGLLRTDDYSNITDMGFGDALKLEEDKIKRKEEMLREKYRAEYEFHKKREMQR